MSYGTILYPKPLDFPLLMNAETSQRAIDTQVKNMTDAFGVFRMLSVCTPKDVFSNPIEEITEKVESAFRDYVDAYNTMCDLQDAIDLHEQAAGIKEGETYSDGTPKRPYLYYNHFIYHSKEEAESLITENTAELTKIKAKILGICLATPIDITPRDQVQYSDGHYEPLSYLEFEMNYVEESLDECLRTIRVATLTAKYWDGHEEG